MSGLAGIARTGDRSFHTAPERRRLRTNGWLRGLAAATVALGACAAHAHGGEDHDLAEPAAGGGLKPRVAMHGEAVELLGVLTAPGELRLYIDDYATNAPLEQATVELESGGRVLEAERLAPGEYRLKAPALAQAGEHALVITVESGALLELLNGKLSVPEPAEPEEHAHAAGLPRWLWLAVGLALLGLLAWGLRRRGTVVGLTALALAIGLAPGPVSAHDGEEHGSAAPASAELVEGQPKRLADGTVFLPKPTQHLLGIRTVPAQTAPARRALILNGRIIADANAGGLVAAGAAGRIRPGPQGFPVLGAPIRAGEILAYLEPVLSGPERAALSAELAERQAGLGQAEARVARYGRLSASIPAKERAAAAAEAASLKQRVAALNRALHEAEPVLASVSGVVARRSVVAGQVVAAGETLFSLHDPARHWVEALAYEPALVDRIAGAELVLNGRRLPLKLLGAGRELTDQAVPVQFALAQPATELAVDQPVRVLVELGEASDALVVPEAAVVRGAEGLNVVFVHSAPERFEPHRVEVEPVSGGRMAVRRGLAKGDRVVSAGASLLAQVR